MFGAIAGWIIFVLACVLKSPVFAVIGGVMMVVGMGSSRDY